MSEKKKLNFIQQFVWGSLVPLKGMELLLRDRSLRRLSLWPFLIYIVVFLLGLYFSAPLTEGVSVWAKTLMGESLSSGFWGGLVSLSVKVMSWLFFVLALGYSVFLVANIIATPFYSLLAEKLLRDRGQLPDDAQSLRDFMGRNGRLLFHGLVKSIIFLVLGIILFLLSLIPAIGVVATFGFFLIIAFDCSDYSYEAMLWSFRQRVRFFISHWPAYFGVALIIGFIFMIPVMNVLLFPLAVVGATDLFSRLYKGV